MDTIVNLSPLVSFVVQVMSGIILMLLPFAVSKAFDFARLHFHMKLTDHEEAVMAKECTTVAGILLQKISAGKMPLSAVHIHDAGIQLLANDALDRVQMAGTNSHLSANDVAARIVSQVFHLVSSDPTIATIQPQPVVAPATTVTQEETTHA